MLTISACLCDQGLVRRREERLYRPLVHGPDATGIAERRAFRRNRCPQTQHHLPCAQPFASSAWARARSRCNAARKARRIRAQCARFDSFLVGSVNPQAGPLSSSPSVSSPHLVGSSAASAHRASPPCPPPEGTSRARRQPPAEGGSNVFNLDDPAWVQHRDV